MGSKRIFSVVSEQQKKALYDSIKSSSHGDSSYYFLVALGAVVATFGLLSNSTAVIIGAMLISPIMSPIIGMSFSITTGDSRLFSQSIKAIIFGAFLALIISVFVTLLLPSSALTSEMLARSKPTTIDLIVALASGAAAAYTMCHNKGLTVLPGVAIATALMPPLCVVGSGLALSNYSVALGGTLLFLANLIAINLSAAVIFEIVGFTTKDDTTIENDDGTLVVAENKKHRLLLSITAFVIISIPLTYFMYNTISTERTDRTIQDALKATISAHEGVDLVNYSYKYSDNKYYISTVVRSDTSLVGNDIVEMENYLESKLNKPTEVTMQIVFATEINALTNTASEDTTIGTADDKAKSGSGSEETDTSQSGEVATSSELTADKFIKHTIEEKCALINASLVDFSFSYNSDNATYTVNATLSGDADKVSNIKDSITTVLEDSLNRKVDLAIYVTAEAASTDTAVSDPPTSDDIYNIG